MIEMEKCIILARLLATSRVVGFCERCVKARELQTYQGQLMCEVCRDKKANEDDSR
jgi:hypothetical protein